MELEINEYISPISPQHETMGHFRCSCEYFSFKFTSGVYFLIGEIDSGAWAFTYSLSDATKRFPSFYASMLLQDYYTFSGFLEEIRRYKDFPSHYKSILLNGVSCDLLEIQKQSFYVGQKKIYGKKTFECVLNEALKKSKNDCSYDEMLGKLGKFDFKNCDFREEAKRRWRMNFPHDRIWYLSSLIGLALKKKIFLFPWISKQRYDFFLSTAIELLADEDVIVIVPCSEKIQFPTGDRYNIVDFKKI